MVTSPNNKITLVWEFSAAKIGMNAIGFRQQMCTNIGLEPQKGAQKAGLNAAY
jgi:hypothetical protein